MRRLCAAGLPMGLQYSITAIGSVSVQTAVNSFGEIAVAGVTAANKVYNILCCPQDALGATMATFAGQNIGAGRLDRVTKGLRAACITGFACSLLMLAVVLTSGRALAGIFLNANETQALDYAQQFHARNRIGPNAAHDSKLLPLHHTGHGLFDVCDAGRCAGNDCPLLCGVWPGALVWIQRRMLFQHMRMVCRGLLPHTGILLVPQARVVNGNVRRAAQLEAH